MKERERRKEQQNGRKTERQKERKKEKKTERYMIVLESHRNMDLQLKQGHHMITKRPVWDALHLENQPEDTKSHSGSNPDPPK